MCEQWTDVYVQKRYHVKNLVYCTGYTVKILLLSFSSSLLYWYSFTTFLSILILDFVRVLFKNTLCQTSNNCSKTRLITPHSFFCVFYYIISYSCICCRDMSDIEFRWQICTLIIQKLLLKVMFILDLWYHRCSKQLRHKSTLITVHWLKYIGASCQQFWPQIMRCQAWKWIPFRAPFIHSKEARYV